MSVRILGLLLLLSGCLSPVGSERPEGSDLKEIVGDDNRIPIEEATGFELAAEATAWITNYNEIDAVSDTHYELSGGPLGERKNLCEGERFEDDFSARGHGTGFLVGPNLMATAGHIVHNGKNLDCTDLVIVFGHQGDAGGLIPRQNVYACKRLLARRFPSDAVGNGGPRLSGPPDYALIEIAPWDEESRPVRPWLELAEDTREIEEVHILGHPLGLPLLVSTPTTVRTVAEHYLLADGDVSAGNSGGPTLGDQMEVHGITAAELNRSLVARGDCNEIDQAEEGCTDCGSLSTRIDSIRPFVENWPEAEFAVLDQTTTVDLERGTNELSAELSSNDMTRRVLLEVWAYNVKLGQATIRLAHESGYRSPILRLERTGTEGYRIIARTLELTTAIPAGGTWTLEILSHRPREQGAIHRWRLSIAPF